MPRARKPSDDAYNARRRAKRQAARMERQGDTAGAATLRDHIARSYAGGSVTPAALDVLTSTARAQTSTAAQAPVSTSGAGAAPLVQASAVRTSRARKASDDVYNARRRITRQAEKLERDAAQQPEAIRQQMLSFAKSLREKAEGARGKMDEATRAKALEELANLRERTRAASFGFSSVYRRNLIFMQQLNAAGTKDADSSISQRDKDVFWMAVKGLWPDGTSVPRNERYNRIIDHFYFSDTSDAEDFRAWLAQRGIDVQDVTGDLPLIFEYITTELNPDTDEPEVPYDELKKTVLTLR